MTPHPDLRQLESRDESRGRVAEHVRTCSECRLRLAGDDPTRLFALLVDRPTDAAILDAVSARVRREIASGKTGRRPAPSRGVAAAAWVAAAVLAGLILTPLPPAPTRIVSSGLAGEAAVEVVSSPGAPDVVDLSVGEVRLVMIFDREMDL